MAELADGDGAAPPSVNSGEKWEWVGPPIHVRGRKHFYDTVKMTQIYHQHQERTLPNNNAPPGGSARGRGRARGRERGRNASNDSDDDADADVGTGGAGDDVEVHQRTRIFKVGDVVVINGDDGQKWVAQIVQLLQEHCYDTQDVQVVEDDTRCLRMRCTLRWLYQRTQVEQIYRPHVSRELFPQPVPAELCFSDHVEPTGSNPLEIIQGKAYLTENLRKHKLQSTNLPVDFQPGDIISLVRIYFDNVHDSPSKSVRELEHGELGRLLAGPSTESLFSPRWTRMLVKKGVVKRTGGAEATAGAIGSVSAGIVYAGCGSNYRNDDSSSRTPPGLRTTNYVRIPGLKNHRFATVKTKTMALKDIHAVATKHTGVNGAGAGASASQDGTANGKLRSNRRQNQVTGMKAKRKRVERIEDGGRVMRREAPSSHVGLSTHGTLSLLGTRNMESGASILPAVSVPHNTVNGFGSASSRLVSQVLSNQYPNSNDTNTGGVGGGLNYRHSRTCGLNHQPPTPVSSSQSLEIMEYRYAGESQPGKFGTESAMGGHGRARAPARTGPAAGARSNDFMIAGPSTNGTINSPQQEAVGSTALSKISQVYARLHPAQQKRARRILDIALSAVFPSIGHESDHTRDEDELVDQVVRALLYSL